MTNRATLEVTVGSTLEDRARRADKPFRILVFAGLSGSRRAPDEPLRSHRIAVDNLDQMMRRLGPAIQLDLHGAPPIAAKLVLNCIDDLHPDRLIEAVEPLHDLIDLHDRLGNSLTERDAIDDLAKWIGRAAETADPAGSRERASEKPGDPRTHASTSQTETDAELLERLLGRRPAEPAPSPAKRKVEALIRGALADAPSGSSDIAKQTQLRVSELLTRGMRSVLADPSFRDLERAWRSIHWLVSRIDEEHAEVHVVDLSKESLAAELRGLVGAQEPRGDTRSDGTRLQSGPRTTSLEGSPLDALIEAREQDDAWDFIVADYTFALNQDDLMLLATIGALASRLGARAFAHADLSLCGCTSGRDPENPTHWSVPEDDLGLLWREIRGHRAAQWIGLATPRFLLRYPFGKRSDPIESFDFEELPSQPGRDSFLWGNPAFACAYLAAERHAANDESPDSMLAYIADLPAPIFHDGTGDDVQPPIELLLSERARAAAARHGVVAFAGGRNSNQIATAELFGWCNLSADT